MPRRSFAAFAAIVTLGSVGASYATVELERSDLADALHGALIRSCHRGIAERSVNQAESIASVRANRLVATDPSQPRRTRRARMAQVRAGERAIRSRALRLPPAFDCQHAFPR